MTTEQLSEITARHENVDGVMVRDDRGTWIKDTYGGHIKVAPIQHLLTALEQAQRRCAWLEHRVTKGHMKWCSYNATDAPDGDYCNCGLAKWLAAEPPTQEEA